MTEHEDMTAARLESIEAILAELLLRVGVDPEPVTIWRDNAPWNDSHNETLQEARAVVDAVRRLTK